MPSEQRPEKLKLVVDPEERVIFGDDWTPLEADLESDPERRLEGASFAVHPDQDEPAGARGRTLPMIVAGLALAGFVAVVWYAYTWGVGGVDPAELPLIQAEPGPVKSRPESPGGLEVPHQDKLILNELAPDPDKPQVERLLPPPETPKPPAAAQPEIAGPPVETELEPVGRRAESAPASSAAPPPPVAEAPTAEAAAAPQAETPAAEDAAAPRITAPAPDQPAPPAVPETAPEPPQIAAQPSPAEPPKLAKPAAPAPAASAPAVQTAARTPSGAYVVQLASLKDRTGTKPAWVRLQKAHPKLLGDKELTVQAIDLGDRGTFYRVQAGFFPDRPSASALCRALKARQQDCLVVKR